MLRATPRGDNLGELKPFEMEAHQENWGLQLTISPVRHSHRTMSVFTPPNPVRKPLFKSHDKSHDVLGKLMELHKMGILSKTELRTKVLEWDPSQSSKTVPVPTTTAATNVREAVVEAAAPEKAITPKTKKATPKTKGKKRQSRPGKPETEEAKLRKLAREPTRRRFFGEYSNPFSIL